MSEMEEKQLMHSQIYNSAWEAQNKLEGEEPVSNSNSNAGEQELPLEEEDDYQKFLLEEEAKRKRFQEQMGLQGEEQLDFKPSEVVVQQ